MRISRGALAVTLLMLTTEGARAGEPGESAPPSPPPAPPNAESPRRPIVNVPANLLGRLVEVKTVDGKVEGKLLVIEDEKLVLEDRSKERFEVARVDVLSAQLLYDESGLRRVDPTLPVPPPEPVYPAPQPQTKPPSPLGFWVGIAAGPTWLQKKNASASYVFGLDFTGSLYFLYASLGLGFSGVGAPSFSNNTTDGIKSSGGGMAGYASIDAGLTKGLFIPYNATEAIELRPGVGVGTVVESAGSQSIADCIDCDRRTVGGKNGGQYLRFQLGVYYSIHPEGSLVHHVLMARNGFFMGGTLSVQQFIGGDLPRFDRIMTFALAFGWGP